MPGENDRPVLVARRVDSWLVGWLAVAVWAFAWLLHSAHIRVGIDLVGPVYWTGAIVTAAHFGLSYHLAYGSGSTSVQQRRAPLLVVPAVLVAGLLTVAVVSVSGGAESTRHATSGAITFVYLLTTWHYVKQVYGIGRVGAAFANVRLTPTETMVLRFGLYPLAFLGAARVLINGVNYSLDGYLIGFGILPPDVLTALKVAVVVGACVIGIVLVGIRRRAPLPGLLLASYVAAFLWLAVPVSQPLTILLLAPLHGLQYLAIGHRAEIAVAATRAQRISVAWWLNIFAGAAAGGLLLTRWLPRLLDGWLTQPGEPLLFAALLFVFLNLHHYLIDATIWRSSGQLVRAVVRRQGPQPPMGQPALSSTAAMRPIRTR